MVWIARTLLLTTVAMVVAGCGGEREAPSLPAGATHISLSLDESGFHGANIENTLNLPPQQDVVLHLETAAPLARFSIRSHSVEALVTSGRPGQLVFRTLGCRRSEGCGFEAVVVVGAGDAVTRGRLLLSPENDDAPEAESGVAEETTTDENGAEANADEATAAEANAGEASEANAGEAAPAADEDSAEDAPADQAAAGEIPEGTGEGTDEPRPERSSESEEDPAARRDGPSEPDHAP